MKFNENCIPEFAKSPQVIGLVTETIENIASVARSTGPVDTEEYVDTIRTGIIQTPYRIVGKVIADCDHALLVESQTGNLVRALNSQAGRG